MMDTVPREAVSYLALRCAVNTALNCTATCHVTTMPTGAGPAVNAS